MTSNGFIIDFSALPGNAVSIRGNSWELVGTRGNSVGTRGNSMGMQWELSGNAVGMK